jgi:rRNA maturation endonuclease Nob1
MAFITVNRTVCFHCERDFYEIDWDNLSECPHCGEGLLDACEVLEQEDVDVYVDHETGELYFG